MSGLRLNSLLEQAVRAAGNSPVRIREVAAQLEAEAAERNLFVRINAAWMAGRLYAKADLLDARPYIPEG
jgi:hypothetical protein